MDKIECDFTKFSANHAPDSTLLSSVNYSELGVPDTAWEGWAFTGEMRSENGTQYHRARHLAPSLGIWASLDPFEGLTERPMSLNGYSWVEGNVANATDASGNCPENPWWNDIPGQRCVYLVNRLCDIHGCSEAGRQALMRLELSELEAITLAETVSYWGGFGRWTGARAAIIPNLFIENPRLALQSIQEFFSCGEGSTILGMAAVALPAPGIGGGAGAANLGWIGAAGLTIGLLWYATQEYTRSQPQVRERERTKEDRGYDLAFGIAQYLREFALSFARDGERPAYYFLYWPESITTRNGQELMLARSEIFKAEFDFVIGSYLSQIPDGKFKFNLSGMDSGYSENDSLTTWELKQLSTTPIYSIRTEYYLFVGSGRIRLDPMDATIRISTILSR